MQLFSTECFRLTIYIASFNAVHRNADVVFWCACKILEAKLILDGNEQVAVRFEQFSYAAQHAESRVSIGAEHAGVFEYADECHYVELLIDFKIVKPFSEYCNVIKISRSARGNRGAARAAFQREHVRSNFAKVAADRTASCADLQD
ncbi:hypothetical protein ALP29_200034 [Pseudomonas syringae pv. avii]|uniref:Uncharacterized protein n=1 Tax=Pseudomonas syringae pv. avii TaxID=663959 RepID=A0A3M5VIE8_PSESX|nr:hypothetical protein ALP29_200034 [Pseudomonas syringae pv. avii]